MRRCLSNLLVPFGVVDIKKNIRLQKFAYNYLHELAYVNPTLTFQRDHVQ